MGVSPSPTPPILLRSPQCAAINRTNINVQELAVTAALTGKREHVYHAVMADPLTGALLTLDRIRSMVDELFAAHKAFLPPDL
jgi:alpha-galactosidase